MFWTEDNELKKKINKQNKYIKYNAFWKKYQ